MNFSAFRSNVETNLSLFDKKIKQSFSFESMASFLLTKIHSRVLFERSFSMVTFLLMIDMSKRRLSFRKTFSRRRCLEPVISLRWWLILSGEYDRPRFFCSCNILSMLVRAHPAHCRHSFAAAVIIFWMKMKSHLRKSALWNWWTIIWKSSIFWSFSWWNNDYSFHNISCHTLPCVLAKVMFYKFKRFTSSVYL